MKLKSVFFGSIILAGALYGGAKGYIYYRTSTELDKMIMMAEPFADIRYQGVSSSFEGTIAVENISIYPSTSNDEITIESMQMRGDGPMFLYQLIMGDLQKKPPEKFGFSIKGFSIPLGGDLASNYVSMMENVKQMSGVKDSDGCGLMTGLSPDMMGALGFYAITMDTALDIDFDQAAGRAEVLLDFDVRDVEYSQMSMLLTNVPQPGAMVMGMQKPQFSKMSVTYQIDSEFVTKAQEYCAKARGLTVDAFVQSMLDLDEKQLAQQLGFVPGPGLLEAIKSFIKKPNEVSFGIYPPAEFDPASLSFYKPEDLPAMLNLELSVNGEPVTDLSFTMPEKAMGGADSSGGSGLASQLSEAEGVFSSGARQPRKLKKYKPTKDYVPTPVAELHSYLDENVRVYVDQEDAVRKGTLMSVERDKVTIKQRLYGGDMTVDVPLKDIARVEVYRLSD